MATKKPQDRKPKIESGTTDEGVFWIDFGDGRVDFNRPTIEVADPAWVEDYAGNPAEGEAALLKELRPDALEWTRHDWAAHKKLSDAFERHFEKVLGAAMGE